MTRARKVGYDYAKLNSQGKEASRRQEASADMLEEGQIVDSLLQVHPSDDEFSVDIRSTEPSVVESNLQHGLQEDTDLDYDGRHRT